MQYVLTFLEGMLAFLSPCILPMLPIYLIYLSGRDLAGGKRMIVNTIAFVAGFTTVFVLLGASATTLGRLLSQHVDLVRIIGGIIMVVLGLSFMDIPFIRSLKEKLPFGRSTQSKMTDTFIREDKPLKIGSSYLFGMAYSLTWAPCVSTWLSAALIQASQAETVWHGVLLLLLFSLGLGVPFILTAVLFNQAKGILDKIKKHMKTIQRIAGLLLVIAGIAMIFDFFDYYARLFN